MTEAACRTTKAERRHEAILRDLASQIVAGTIPAASRLPYESELATRHAVSRTVGRDAAGSRGRVGGRCAMRPLPSLETSDGT